MATLFPARLAIKLWVMFSLMAGLCMPSFAGLRQLEFFENKGQWEKHILYKTETGSGAWFIEKNQFTFLLQDAAKIKRMHHLDSIPKGKDEYFHNDQLHCHALQYQWKNALQSPTPTVEGRTSYHRNYFIGNDPKRWASDVFGYTSVTLNNLYPGVDVQYYSQGPLPKYDVLIHPGASLSQVALTILGAESLRLSKGKLLIETSLGTLREEAPTAWQYHGDEQVAVACRFKLRGNELSFEVPNGYDSSLTLYIDPVLVFSTFTGSGADNWGFTAATDTLGNAYAGGNVAGTGYPLTLGAFDVSFSSLRDISITKFNATASQLIYSTYLGGIGMENPSSMIVNSAGELIVLATTSSIDFPTTIGAFDNSFNGGDSVDVIGGIRYGAGVDIVITHFSASGSSLIGSTYFGGSRNDGVNLSKHNTGKRLVYNYGDEFRGEVNLDSQGNIFIASSTFSSNIPITAYNTGFNIGQDALVAKFNSSLSQLIWSARIGGLLDDAAFGIIIGKSGIPGDLTDRIYITGGTGGNPNFFATNNFPTTAGAYIPTERGAIDGFVCRLSANGLTLEGSTFLGTPDYDQSFFIQQDSSWQIYVMGQTMGNYPKTPGKLTTSNAGQFVHSLNPALTASNYSFVLGTIQNRPNFVPTAFLVNECNLIYLSGWGGNVGGNTYSFNIDGGNITGLPLPNATQATTDNRDFYLCIIDRNATQVLFGTYLGGNQGTIGGSGEHVDGGTSRFDKKGSVYQAVCAGCGGFSSFPTTAGVWSNTNGALNCNQAVFKYDLSFLDARFNIPGVVGIPPAIPEGCQPLTINFENVSVSGTEFFWNFGDGDSSVSFNPTHTYTDTGIVTIRLIARDPIICQFYDTAFRQIRIRPTPQATVSLPVTLCIGDTVRLQASGGTSYQWSPSQNISAINIPNPLVYPTSSTIYMVRVRNEFNCFVDRTVPVFIRTDFELDISANPEKAYVPFQAQFINNTVDGDNFRWQFHTGDTSDLRSPSFIYNKSGKYPVIVTGFIPGSSCIDRDTIYVEGFDFLIPNVVTPNGDGENDTFKFEAQLSTFKIVIYNRWGRPVYRSDQYDYSWAGQNEPAGSYYYHLVERERELEFTGWIQLIK
jgi:gliding motility-associated-like protein